MSQGSSGGIGQQQTAQQPQQQAPGTTLNSLPANASGPSNPLPSGTPATGASASGGWQNNPYWTQTLPGSNQTAAQQFAQQTAQADVGNPSAVPTSAGGLTWTGAPNWWSDPGKSNVSPGVTMTWGGPIPNGMNPDGTMQGTMTGAQQQAWNAYNAGAGQNTMTGNQWMAAGMPAGSPAASTPSAPSSPIAPGTLSGPQMQSDMIAAHLPAWANGSPLNRSPYMIGQVPGMQQQVATARNALAANGTPYPSAGIPGQQLGMGDASGMTGQSSMMGGGMGPLASAAMAGLGG